MASATSPASHSEIFRFYIHASKSFPWPASPKASKEATKAWSQSPGILPTLQHLSAAEQEAVVRYYHAADASRCLSSYLLKHLAIIHGAGVPFSQSTITQERNIRNGKPFYGPGGMDFNVSHHGDYVVCIGSTIPGTNVGIDIMEVDVAKDRKRIDEKGFKAWVDVFSDVLSEKERNSAVWVESTDGLEAGLRQFYTFWSCKEAYVKMTSDALMATWLKELDFPGLGAPQPSTDELWGQTVVTSVVLQGELLDDVRIEITALGEDHIVACAVDNKVGISPFELVEVGPGGSTLECHRDRHTVKDLRIYKLTE